MIKDREGKISVLFFFVLQKFYSDMQAEISFIRKRQ